jgi:hypothetical protein
VGTALGDFEVGPPGGGGQEPGSALAVKECPRRLPEGAAFDSIDDPVVTPDPEPDIDGRERPAKGVAVLYVTARDRDRLLSGALLEPGELPDEIVRSSRAGRMKPHVLTMTTSASSGTGRTS